MKHQLSALTQCSCLVIELKVTDKSNCSAICCKKSICCHKCFRIKNTSIAVLKKVMRISCHLIDFMKEQKCDLSSIERGSRS